MSLLVKSHDVTFRGYPISDQFAEKSKDERDKADINEILDKLFSIDERRKSLESLSYPNLYSLFEVDSSSRNPRFEIKTGTSTTEKVASDIIIPQDAKEFASLHDLDKEIYQVIKAIEDSFLFNKIEIELFSDYETDFQQICFSIFLKISYDNLVKLRKRFNQKVIQLNMPIEKEKYFVFSYEREEL